MQTYIMLAKLTAKGREDIRGIMERRQRNLQELQARGIRIVADYAVLGPYDFVYIIEAPDNETIVRQIVKDSGSGHLEFHTMLAVPLDKFEQLTKDVTRRES
ncbi:GYD domain-containing protein [Kallotenue papyrolyticum]|uniref:GYD domain-containing protein n=1 Tax=Kallotenue papyrolyticum TaxID=1325125 RepID=UPI0004726428|nr:GYD domain-containing protein [Kallotenue papyrolyticum]